MKWMKLALLGAAAWIQMAAPAKADPFNPAQVPADAKWVVHIDVDAAQKSAMWDILKTKLDGNAGFQTKLRELQAISGNKLPEDLHDVTLCGTGFGEENTVALIHANADQKRLLDLLQLNKGFGRSTFGSREVLTWEDQGKQLYGCFVATDRIVMGRSKDRVESALGVLDGKTSALKLETPLARGITPGVLVYIAGNGLAGLRQADLARSPLLAKIDTAWLSLSEQDKHAAIHAELKAESPQTAEQLRASAEGLKAMAALAGSGTDVDEKAKAVAAMAQTANITLKESTVSVQWDISLEDIRAVVESAGQKQSTTATSAGQR